MIIYKRVSINNNTHIFNKKIAWQIHFYYTAENTENTSIIETQEGTSVTDKITIENQSRDNINMTLKEKGKFDEL